MIPLPLPVTLVTACVLALMGLILAARVSRVRMKHRISLGDKGNEELMVRMRIHGNFIEFVPFVLILMALLESSGANSTALTVAGAVLVVSRFMHAFGMPRPAPNIFRAGGASLTYLLMATLALWGLSLAIPA